MDSTTTPDQPRPPAAASGITRALRRCLNTGVVLLDGEMKLARLSPEAAAMLELGPTCLASALPSVVLDVAREVLASGKALPGREVELSTGNGRGRVLQLSAVLAQVGDQAVAAVALGELTSLTDCEEHLQHLERLANAGKLAAGTAHEIRNALVAGKTFIDLLLEKNRDADLAQVVHRELTRVDGLVKRLLKFPGSERHSMKPVHLHEVLEYSLHLVKPQLAGKSISIERVFRAGRDMVLGDEQALQQAFLNLLLNALEAMSGQGTLRVATELSTADGSGSGTPPDPAQVRVRIQDTGAGVSPEHLEHLFEPFFSTKPGGTGLGLAITQRIIQEHRGQIQVQSHAGQGTTFIVLLPEGHTGA